MELALFNAWGNFHKAAFKNLFVIYSQPAEDNFFSINDVSKHFHATTNLKVDMYRKQSVTYSHITTAVANP